MKKVLIASFQRSGTHFLINNLGTNFQGFEAGWEDILNRQIRESMAAPALPDLQQRIWQQLQEYDPTPRRRCVKTHYQAYFFEPYLDSILEKYDVIYVVRDPRDTMVACYHYYNLTPYEPFIKEPVFSKFIRADLSKVKTETDPFSYSHVKPANLVDKWNQHVLSWLRYQDRGVVFVRFSDLKFRLSAALQEIEAKTSQRLKPVIQAISVADPRVRPDFQLAGLRRGEVGIWRNYFSASDLQFLAQNISGPAQQFLDK